MKIRYQEAKLSDVLEFFIQGFNIKEGKIINSEKFIDTVKETVIFKLYIEDNANN